MICEAIIEDDKIQKMLSNSIHESMLKEIEEKQKKIEEIIEIIQR